DSKAVVESHGDQRKPQSRPPAMTTSVTATIAEHMYCLLETSAASLELRLLVLMVVDPLESASSGPLTVKRSVPIPTFIVLPDDRLRVPTVAIDSFTATQIQHRSAYSKLCAEMKPRSALATIDGLRHAKTSSVGQRGGKEDLIVTAFVKHVTAI
ncbi:hypothetical protein M8C21_022740, partial [Ambrosia artemisiifolia]